MNLFPTQNRPSLPLTLDVVQEQAPYADIAAPEPISH